MIYEYDGSGEVCPLPLVNMRVLLKKMQQGDMLLLRIADSGSKTDIPKLLLKQGYQFEQKQLANNMLELKIFQH